MAVTEEEEEEEQDEARVGEQRERGESSRLGQILCNFDNVYS